MSFDVDVAKRLGDAEIACRIEGGAGLTVLFGPSGAGKTSVLNMVAGLIEPDRGHVRVSGETCSTPRWGSICRPSAGACGLCVPGSAAVPASSRACEPALWLAHGEGAVDVDETIALLGSRPCSIAGRAPVGRRGPRVAIGRALLSNPRSCCSTSPCRRSTARGARRSWA
jgi:molybdate transport system ATP-binding protein